MHTYSQARWFQLFFLHSIIPRVTEVSPNLLFGGWCPSPARGRPSRLPVFGHLHGF